MHGERFRLEAEFEPQGDQPAAIEQLLGGLEAGDPHQVLLGVTGSGKTFTMASMIERAQRPALVIAHNKTLAAQLYQEFTNFFPDNAVEYFVSYYDYYQPEAYVPSTDTYIAKETLINEEIDRMRHSATRSIWSRRDLIVVASVSCIYGLGAPESYYGLMLSLEVGQRIDRQDFLRQLVDLHYTRRTHGLERGGFRVRGEEVELLPTYGEEALRIAFDDDEIVGIAEIDPLLGDTLREHQSLAIFPASHYVTTSERRGEAIQSIKIELDERLGELQQEGKMLEAQRLHQRTMFDLEMMQTVGYCHGIENYSRHLTLRHAGEPPPNLIEYLPDDHLVFIDESHMTVPQLRGMCEGDRSRKLNLVSHGFRLPSALDNRPLNFDEIQDLVGQTVHVSATPGPWELEASGGVVVQQIIRPTGLIDPVVEVRPATGQVDDLLAEVRLRVDRDERVLVTTLTKRMAEELTDYYGELGVRVRYLHSDIDTLDRVKLLRDFRRGDFDVLVGVNLLREGLDLPEVTLVAVLDADKEGFLRSATALIQTTGRAARNIDGRVILYAEKVTDSMQEALDETERRRAIQQEYNDENGIVPETVIKHIADDFGAFYSRDYMDAEVAEEPDSDLSAGEVDKRVAELEKEMLSAAEELDFEQAASIRDQMQELRRRYMGLR
ncbi:MAG: excinuclease ABC subunit UvrB [Acidobacteria bacterium]|nr:excinuclease ABC subunit UvrB [Acidobacteriota bacterium]